MKKFTIALAALAFAPALALADAWSIDPVHSNSAFAVKHLVIATVRGHFGKTTGTAQIDDADVTKSSVEATIDATTITTGIEKRDGHLKSPDFFDVAKYPTLTSQSKKVVAGKDGAFQLVGDMTMHGVTKEVTLDAIAPSKIIKGPRGESRVGASATTKINRRDFGLNWNQVLEAGGVLVGERIKLTLDLSTVRA